MYRGGGPSCPPPRQRCRGAGGASASTDAPSARSSWRCRCCWRSRLFAWWPLLRAGVLSVQRSNLVDTPSFVGLENFREVLADPLLWTAVKNTAWFVFLALVFGFPIPLLLAVMISELRRNRGLYSALAYLPVVIPPVASILLWQRFFDASPTGTFNTILGWFGLGPWPWIQDPTWAMPSIVL